MGKDKTRFLHLESELTIWILNEPVSNVILYYANFKELWTVRVLFTALIESWNEEEMVMRQNLSRKLFITELVAN